MSMNYGNYNPYLQQMRVTPLKMIPVSNIMEANAMPVDTLDPVFFFNRAENVVYKKQIDNTGAAPIQIFKLELPQSPKNEEKQVPNINPYEKDFKGINDKIEMLQKTFEDYIKSQNEYEEDVEVIEHKKGNKK